MLNGGSGSWDSYDEIKELFGSNGRLLSNVAVGRVCSSFMPRSLTT